MEWAPLVLSLEVASLSMLLALVAGTGIAILLDWKRMPARDFLYLSMISNWTLGGTGS